MWRWRTRSDEDFSKELQTHITLDIDRFLAEGMTPAEARAAALRAFGNVTGAQERFYESRRLMWRDNLQRDVRYALRTFVKNPGFTAVAVLTLALGIGANTAIFSVVAGLTLRPLPVRDPDRLALVSTNSSISYRPPFSYATFEELKRRAHFFDGGLAFSGCCGESTLRIADADHAVSRQFVSGDFLATLGVRPLRGRLLTPTDNEPDAPEGPVAFVSYRLWRRLGLRDDMVGLQVSIDHVPFTIVGIAPPDFFGVEVGREFDVLVPLRLNARLSRMSIDDDMTYLDIMVRLKPGVSLEAAEADLRTVQPQIRAGAAPKRAPNGGFLTDPLVLRPVATGMSVLRDRFERPLLAIFAVVLLVLLVACANLGNLFLARAMRRAHEWSVRVALGASRWRLAQQLLTEALVVAMAGAALGLVFASSLSRLLVSQLSTARSPIALDVSVDWRVLTFTTTVAIAAAILFAVTPALWTRQVAPVTHLKQHGRGQRTALSSGLIIAQLALSLTLVVAAALFVQTFTRLAHASTGFNRDGVVMTTVNMSTVPFASRPAVNSALVDGIRQMPNVAAAGASLNPPFIGPLAGDLVVSPPGTLPPPEAERISRLDAITPGWLATFGIAIETGRDFDDHDSPSSPRVMIVNRAFVRRLLPDRAPLGATLAVTLRYPPYGDFPYGVMTIVGIVGDTVFRSLRDDFQPMMYVPLSQSGPTTPYTDLYLAARPTAGSAALLQRGVASTITNINHDVMFSSHTLSQDIEDSLAEDRLTAMLSGLFGALALLLASVGLYGTTVYTIGQRRGEIGIRIALGATGWDIITVFVGRALVHGAIGTILGLGLAYAASRAVGSLLYGVTIHDPRSFLGAAVVLLGIVVLASYLPARRATHVDPMVALRCE